MEVCKTKELYTNNLDLGKPKAGKYFSTFLWVTVFKTLFPVIFFTMTLSQQRTVHPTEAERKIKLQLLISVQN